VVAVAVPAAGIALLAGAALRRISPPAATRSSA
jgi:hypothetical protein